MTIPVENQTGSEIEVRINRWDEDENTSTDYFPIPHNGVEDWNRSSEYGYVMSVKHEAGLEKQYYVMAEDNYAIQDADEEIFVVYNKNTQKEVKPVEHY